MTALAKAIPAITQVEPGNPLRVLGQPALQRFWYPVMRSTAVDDGPKAFRLLGQDIVVWRDGRGKVAALQDRCCHRTAKLSRGFVDNGVLACGYHGWQFDGDGACVRIPQNPQLKPNFGVIAYKAQDRYGYVWVCLGEPQSDIPDIPEAETAGFRQIHEFDEVWNCSAFRIMENSFDNAHFSFVHRSSFGQLDNPDPSMFTFAEHDWGFEAHSLVPVNNPALQKQNLKIGEDKTMRDNLRIWWMPFSRKLRIKYPNGLQHVIITAATPIDDGHSQLIQFAYRNDSEAEAPASGIIAFDRQVTNEDRFILETTEPSVPLDAAWTGEAHMASDQPSMIMRRKLKALIAESAR